nr:serine/threonine protein kinase [Nostocaceae cyanobacterium]
MQPPIPVDTVLQNRYRVLKILGQGGFGRTYLAEDQGRFNELCALKELIPTQTGSGALEKSQELFAREATILYQIQHPQVPQFRATFEQDQRLFLVQDYVAGKTYRALLDERIAVGKTFSELEVSQFLRSLLPVLAQIHSRGIIHRDISPENIMLRSSDQLPVLIDFGVVKELATRFQSSKPESVATTVGKFGYAPSEQMQTGRAYPSSDLYSLAVTSVVLLTGKEPQQLFDDTQLIWDWQRFVNVNPNFAQVINWMLSIKPGDRYQNANDVLQALSPNPISNVNTVAIGRRPDAVIPNRPDIQAPRRSLIDNPWAIGAIGTLVVLVAGIGSWLLVSTLRSQQTTAPAPKQAFPSPIVLGTPTATVTATPIPTTTPTSLGPVSYSQNLELTPGVTTVAQDNLKGNATINFPFNGTQGQKLTVSLADEGVLLSVVGPNQRAIDKAATRVPS